MKCKVCGTENADYLEYCENCAAELVPDTASSAADTASEPYVDTDAPTWGFVKAPSWPKPDFDANTVSEGDIPEDYFKRVSNRPGPVPAKPEASSYDYDAQPVAAQATAPVNEVEPEVSAPVKPIKYADPIDDDYFDYDAGSKKIHDRKKPVKSASSASRSTRGKSGKKNMLFWIAAAALVLIIAVLAVVFLTRDSGGISTFVSGIFSSSAITKDAEVEFDDSDPNEPAYFITVYAKRGSTVRFTAGSLVRENPMEESSMKLRIPVSVWTPTEPVETSTVEIYPDIVVIDKEGVENKVEFEQPIVLNVPEVVLSVTAPATSPFEAASASIDVAGTVDDSTASVFVNGTQFPVDASGNFAGTYTLPGTGEQEITVTAQKNGCKTAVQTFTVNYTTTVAGVATAPSSTGTVAFQVSAEQSRRTIESSLKVSGTVESGATMTATVSHGGTDTPVNVTVNAASGTFEFSVSMSEVGLYTTTISSTKDGVSGSSTIYLERNHADSQAYMEGAYALDYQYMLDSPYHKQAYMITGKVVEVIQASPFVIGRLTTEKGDVVFYYYSGIATIEANDGLTYKVYADPNGRTEDGLPIAYAWYIKKS